MSKHDTRTVQHFGRWYLWGRNAGGALSLISVDRFNQTMRQVNDQLKIQRLASDMVDRGDYPTLVDAVAALNKALVDPLERA